jgi:hypothetical protein
MYADGLRRLAQHNRPVRGYLCLRVRDFESSVLSGLEDNFGCVVLLTLARLNRSGVNLDFSSAPKALAPINVPARVMWHTLGVEK